MTGEENLIFYNCFTYTTNRGQNRSLSNRNFGKHWPLFTGRFCTGRFQTHPAALITKCITTGRFQHRPLSDENTGRFAITPAALRKHRPLLTGRFQTKSRPLCDNTGRFDFRPKKVCFRPPILLNLYQRLLWAFLTDAFGF